MKAKAEAHVIVAVHITNRIQNAGAVQQVFTCYGEYIKTRLGLNDLDKAPSGLILLELIGGARIADELMKHLKRVRGVQTKKIVFEHH